MDDSGQFQVITIPTGGDYSPFLKRFQLCTLCYGMKNGNITHIFKIDDGYYYFLLNWKPERV